MFWLACEELKKETNKTVVEEKVRQIYEDFISILSPKEVRKKEVLSSVSLSVLYQCKTEVNTPLMYYKTPLMCAFPLGQSRFARSRRDKPEHAGANLTHVRGGPTADLHADAEGLVPTLHQLSHIHGSAEEPGGASSRAIRLTHTFPTKRKKSACVPPEGKACLFQLEFRINTS